MQIKRFTARSMSEALQMVKAEMGPEAIILSARSVKNNGHFLDAFRKAGVEVTAAQDTAQTAPAARGSGHVRKSVLSLNRARGRMAYELDSGSVSEDGGYEADRKLRHSGRSRKDDRLRGSWLYRHLIAQDVRKEYALEISSELLSDSAVENRPEEDLRTGIARALRKMGVEARPLVSDGAKRVALIGPAGAGKTACAAKLAAVHATRTGRQVAMISLDNYRIAATGQLQRCADIMGLPLVTAGSPQALRQALYQLETADLILIDTPALRRSDGHMHAKLRESLKVAAADDIHFVCSATRKEKDTTELIATLKDIAINRLLFTKLDETTSHGSLLNLLIQLQIPVSGFSSGQQIPTSLQEAAIEKLAELILSRESQTATDKRFDKNVRKKKPAAQPGSGSAGESFIANKNSYLFHTADCIWTGLIKKENRVVFHSAAEALTRDFKPCRDCCRNSTGSKAFRRWGLNRARSSGGRAGRSDSSSDVDTQIPKKIPVRSA